MEQMQATRAIFGGSDHATRADAGAEPGDTDPEIAIACAAGAHGPVALYWHGVPTPTVAATVLALVQAIGPVRVQRVLVPERAVASACILPRLLERAGAEVVLCAGAPRLAALVSGWHRVVIDDLVRHPELATVVLVAAPAAVVSRVVPVLLGTGRPCVRLLGAGARARAVDPAVAV